MLEGGEPRLVLLNLTVRSFNVSPVGDGTTPCQLIDSGRNIFLIVVFTLIFIVSVIGNSLVILTIVQNRWMRTVTNLFLLNMAISDLLLTLICMPPTLTAMLFECFIWGRQMKWMCTLMSFLQPVSVAANANTLVAIALERYFALCRPLHSRQWQTKRNVVRILIVVWTAACITSIPPTFVVEVIEIRPGQPNCRYNWPSPQAPLIYFIFLSQMVFIIPLIIMTLLYSLVIRSLWLGIKQHHESSVIAETLGKWKVDSNETSGSYSNAIDNSDHWSKKKLKRVLQMIPLRKVNSFPASTMSLSKVAQAPTVPNSSIDNERRPASCYNWSGAVLRSTHAEKNLVTKKRVIKMLTMIVVEFFVCWMPFYSYYLIVIIHPSLFDSSCHVAFLILAYLSTCTNPVTYCFMNSKFRQAFLSAFGCHMESKNRQKERCRSSGGINRREAFKLLAVIKDDEHNIAFGSKKSVDDGRTDASSQDEYGTARDEVTQDVYEDDQATLSNTSCGQSLQSEKALEKDGFWISIQTPQSSV